MSAERQRISRLLKNFEEREERMAEVKEMDLFNATDNAAATSTLLSTSELSIQAQGPSQASSSQVSSSQAFSSGDNKRKKTKSQNHQLLCVV